MGKYPVTNAKTTPLITGEQLAAMPNLETAELVEGVIIAKMPTGHLHGLLEVLIANFLFNHIRSHKLGHILTGEVGIYTHRNPDTVRAADVAFISNERYGRIQSASYLDVAPELIVEIMSPDDRWSDINKKLAEYFAINVQMVWIVDPKLEQIHVYRSLDNVSRLTKKDVLDGGNILPQFAVSLTEIFIS